MSNEEALNKLCYDLKSKYEYDPIEKHCVDLLWEKIQKDLEILQMIINEMYLEYQYKDDDALYILSIQRPRNEVLYDWLKENIKND